MDFTGHGLANISGVQTKYAAFLKRCYRVRHWRPNKDQLHFSYEKNVAYFEYFKFSLEHVQLGPWLHHTTNPLSHSHTLITYSPIRITAN